MNLEVTRPKGGSRRTEGRCTEDALRGGSETVVTPDSALLTDASSSLRMRRGKTRTLDSMAIVTESPFLLVKEANEQDIASRLAGS